MPSVISENGMTIALNVRDEHPPPHVHVRCADWEIRIFIGDEVNFWGIVWGRPSTKDVKKAEELTSRHLEACNAEWRKFHG
jgi:hypothetical protein